MGTPKPFDTQKLFPLCQPLAGQTSLSDRVGLASLQPPPARLSHWDAHDGQRSTHAARVVVTWDSGLRDGCGGGRAFSPLSLRLCPAHAACEREVGRNDLIFVLGWSVYCAGMRVTISRNSSLNSRSSNSGAR